MDADKAAVHEAIIESVLPRLYAVIDALVDAGGQQIPKPVLAEARKLLPRQYKNSFEAAGRGAAAKVTP